MGFAEAVAGFSSLTSAWAIPLLAVGAIVLLFVFAWQGADWTSRFQFAVMALLIAALASFFWGGFSHWKPGSEFNLDQEKERAKKLLNEVRIEAEPFIVDSFNPEKIAEHSIGSSLVFLPFSFQAGSLPGAFGSATKMPASVMVIAAEDIDLDAEPEEGSVALIAEASDALDAAKAKMEKASKRAEVARDTVEKLHQKLSKLEGKISEAVDPERREELEQQVENAEKGAVQCRQSRNQEREGGKEGGSHRG